MNVLVDDIAVELSGDSLGEVLYAAKERLDPAGRLIVEVLLDGEALVGDDLMSRQGEALGDCELRLTTADPRELAVGVLAQVRDQLDRAESLQTEAADCLQRDQQAEALDRVGQAVTIWQHTEQAVRQSAALMDVALESLNVDDEPFVTLTETLVRQLRELRDLLEARDTVAMADVLAYEWPRTTQRWQRLVDELIGTIEA